MYQVKSYWYPQCNSGLFPVLNCSIDQVRDEYQSRNDGYSGTDTMIPIEKNKIYAAMYSKDDVNKDECLVIISHTDIWEIRKYNKFNQQEKIIFKNEILINNKTVIPKIISLFWQWYTEYDVDQSKQILNKIIAMNK